MKIIDTSEVTPDALTKWERDQVYNGLDCCVTAEVLDVLLPQLDEFTTRTYEFSKSLQAPVLEMRLRGVLVDQARKEEVIEEFYEKLDRLERNLDRIVLEGVGMPTFNWRSNPDLRRLFYDYLGIPVIRKAGKPTTDRDALERMEAYSIAAPIVRHLLAIRDLGQKIGVLRTDIDPDGRIRTSYNIAGTSTGRFSSSLSEFGTGTNLQNIEESLRSIFIADPGCKFAKFDAKQGESYVVGGIEWNLFQDGKYLDACESGDIHTAVAKICWPEVHWTGDRRLDKEIAEKPYYRHYSRRFMCKKIGHGTNYGGKPRTLSNQAKIELGAVEQFQPKYFLAFPAHQRWHAWTQAQLYATGTIISLTGRKRQFWGRRNDDSTLREAMGFQGQALVDIVNRGMLNIWHARDAILMMHDHDALTVQYPEEQEDDIVPKILAQLEVPIPLENGRTLLIPYDCKVGWNKGEFDAKTNPDGLRDYDPNDKRRRTPPVHILDRCVR